MRPATETAIARLRWRGLLASLLVAATSAACQSTGAVRVRSLTFHGNHAFESSRLKGIVTTHAGSWVPWSKKPVFDRARFETDLDRLTAFYVDHGYPEAHVTGVHVDLSSNGTTVTLGIDIDEGQPEIVERIDLAGFDGLDPTLRRGLDHLPVTVGDPNDVDKIRAAESTAIELLRNNGFEHATVTAADEPGAAPRRVIVTLTATPGPATTFGPVTIDGLHHVNPSVVMRGVTFKPGEAYKESRVTAVQRRLAALDVFQFVHVGPPANLSDAATVIPMVVSVAEAPPTRLSFGVGYGSEERARGSLSWTDLNLFGDARELTAAAKYSDVLRGASLTYQEPAILRDGVALNGDVHAWWTNEDTYTSRQSGGSVSARYRFGGSPGGGLRTRDELRLTYTHDFVTYAIKPDALADLSNFAERIALGLDPITGSGRGTLAAVEVDLDSAVLDAPADPRRGHSTSLHLEHAAPWLGGTFTFNEILSEGRVYVPMTGAITVAARVRFGTIVAADPTTVPFSERYFLGGASSLRGWGRYEVAPLTDAGLPIGGRSLLESSVELRVLGAGAVGVVFFADAGNVWSNQWQVDLSHLDYDIGTGVRYRTPVGVARADFGYQLTPIANLLVNGLPDSRRWRLHFSIGESF